MYPFNSLQRSPLLFVLLLCLSAPQVSAQTNSAAKSPTTPAADKSGSSASHAKDYLRDTIEFNTEFRENWSNPELPRGMSGGGVVLDSSDRDGFTRELVRAQWRAGDPIDLWVIKPANVKKPPVILYLYSYPSSNGRYNDLEFCKFLTKNGYAAVGFLSALTGERFHDYPLKEWFVSQLQVSLGASVHDVQMVLNYLSDRGDFDMNRVGMWGDGSGASIAIMAAAVDPRIKALDLLDPWGDWPDWLAKSTLVPDQERSDYLKLEFLEKIKDLDPVKWLPQLKTPQVRLQYIKEGVTITPVAARERMEAAASANVQIVHYENKKEFATKLVASGTSFDWIKEQLKVPAAFQANNSDIRANPAAGKNPEQ